MQTVINNDEYSMLTKAVNHILVIEYAFGTAGCLVHRIIGSDKQYYWNKEINNSTDDSIDPLYWPTSNFIYQNVHKLDAKDQQRTCHTGYSCLYLEDEKDKQALLAISANTKLLYMAVKNKQKLIFRTHDPVHIYNNDIKVVRLVGTKPVRKLFTKDTLPFDTHPNTYNLNINNLIDEDYEVFKQEYLALCKGIGITPNIDKVRDFILIWLEKQK